MVKLTSGKRRSKMPPLIARLKTVPCVSSPTRLFSLQLLTKDRTTIIHILLTQFAKLPPRPVLTTRPPLKFLDLWIAVLRLLAFCILITGLSFGARQSFFSVGVSRVWGTELDADLKLALLGFFNKSLDVILVSSLEYTASMTLTIWMARVGEAGATFSDFGLKDELTKPWMTVVSLCTRWRRGKRGWMSVARFALCMCVSVAVMLQGLAVNTIAVPKARWYPNRSHTWKMTARIRDAMTVAYPKTSLEAIDWYNLLGFGQDNVGTESFYPWDWALALSASLSLAGLSRVVPTVALPEKSWQQVYHWQLDGDTRRRWSALNTNFDMPDRPVETISTDDQQVTEIFEWLRTAQHSPISSSTGWTGNLTLIVPALNTLCTPSDHRTQNSSFLVTLPPGTSGTPSETPTFSLRLGPVPALNFTGATCSTTFRQALYPVNIWNVDMRGVDLSFNDYGTDWTKRIVYEPTVAADFAIVRVLAIQTRDSLPRMESLVQTAGLLEYFVRMGWKLQIADQGVYSDAERLSVVLGVLLQNMLSVSNKYRTSLPATLPSHPTEIITSFPIQWQLYGSGPRLAWEWLTVLVLAIVLLSLCFGVYQTLRHWIGSGPWTELGGMMKIAHGSTLLDIGDEGEAQRRLYRVEKGAERGLVLKSHEG
jgi:hypothetical protein